MISADASIWMDYDPDTDVMPRGFPRPRITMVGFEGLPTPYTAQSPDEPGLMSSDRANECAAETRCAMCGEIVEDEYCGIATMGGSDNGVVVVSEDHGLTHEKCAVIVARMCPAFTREGGPKMWRARTRTVQRVLTMTMSDRTANRLGSRTRIQ